MVLRRLPHDEAQRLAAKELASERRASRPARATAPSFDRSKITVATARQFFINEVEAIARRLRQAPRALRNRLNSKRDADMPVVVVRPHVEDPIATTPTPAQLEPTTEAALVFTGRDNTAELIDEREFEQRWRDIPTANWRRSIEHNERKQREREQRGGYIGLSR
jgi:hypothetical protein